jgi:cell volume regulation protein A
LIFGGIGGRHKGLLTNGLQPIKLSIMQDVALIIAVVGIIIFLAHLFTGLFNRIMVPDVIFLIVLGICLGPILGILPPSLFIEIGPIFATITLIIILLECGFTLKLSTLRTVVPGAMALALVIFPLSMAIITGLALWLTDLELLPALILGAIIGSTSEAIVIPLVRQLKIEEKSQALLSVESTVTAVLSIIFALTLIDTYQLGQFQVLDVAGSLIASFLVAIGLGVAGAFIWSLFLNRIRHVKNTMFTTAACVFVIFGVVELLGFNGPIAALAFGITLGNLKPMPFPFFKKGLRLESGGLTEVEKAFFGEIAFLLKTFFFIYLGISLEMISTELMILAAVFTVIIFLLRLVAVRLTVGGTAPAKDASFIAVMAPRGLTAIVLVAIVCQQEILGGELIKSLTYGVVLFSVVLTSLLVLLSDKTRLSDGLSYLFTVGTKPKPDPDEPAEPPEPEKKE